MNTRVANPGYDVNRAVGWERAVLGCLLEAPSLWPKAAELNTGHFQLDLHRQGCWELIGDGERQQGTG
jgi:hypothetical protein